MNQEKQELGREVGTREREKNVLLLHLLNPLLSAPTVGLGDSSGQVVKEVCNPSLEFRALSSHGRWLL